VLAVGIHGDDRVGPQANRGLDARTQRRAHAAIDRVPNHHGAGFLGQLTRAVARTVVHHHHPLGNFTASRTTSAIVRSSL
jgi:hypothetical protein